MTDNQSTSGQSEIRRRESDRQKTRAKEEELKILPQRRPGWYISGAFILLLTAWAALGFSNNSNIDFPVIGEYFLKPVILGGVMNTLVMAALATVCALIIGTILAVMRLSGGPVWAAFSWTYVWFFRSVPLLVLIIFAGNLTLLAPRLGISVPFTGFSLVSVPTNVIMTAFVASVVAISLHAGAHTAEIIRGGILSVPNGQREAVKALAIPALRAFFLVTLPQAMRIIIPPIGTTIISTVLATSLVSVVAGSELMTRVEDISATNLKTMELLIVACLWYLIISSALGLAQYFIERKYGRGYSRTTPVTDSSV